MVMDQGTILSFILFSVTINSIAQIVWRKGAGGALSKVSIKNIIKMMMRPKVIIGLGMYIISALIWILVLSNTEVSYAYPLISLGYVITTILSYAILKEKINKKRILGISVIILGVIIVGLSI